MERSTASDTSATNTIGRDSCITEVLSPLFFSSLQQQYWATFINQRRHVLRLPECERDCFVLAPQAALAATRCWLLRNLLHLGAGIMCVVLVFIHVERLYEIVEGFTFFTLG